MIELENSAAIKSLQRKERCNIVLRIDLFQKNHLTSFLIKISS